MKKRNEVFFGQVGLTNTEANYLANLAKEQNQTDLAKLENLNFLNVTLTAEGKEYKYSKANTIEEIRGVDLDIISQRNSFIAWVREAMKARDKELDIMNLYDVTKYCVDNNIELPTMPSRPKKYTEEDILEELDVEERMEYYRLETEASVIGKIIHPERPYSKALSKMRKQKYTTEVKTEDSNLLVFQYSLIDVNYGINYEKYFMELQEKHREIESKLNLIKSKIMRRRDELNIEAQKEYNIALKKYGSLMDDYTSKAEQYKLEELKRIGSLKILIPDSLKFIYEKLKA